MKKLYILSKNEDFQRIIESKKQIVTASFVLYYEKKEDVYTKIGISISKKLANAVNRNKIKREIKRNLDMYWDFTLKYNIVLIARRKYINLTTLNKVKELKNILNKFNNKRGING